MLRDAVWFFSGSNQPNSGHAALNDPGDHIGTQFAPGWARRRRVHRPPNLLALRLAPRTGGRVCARRACTPCARILRHQMLPRPVAEAASFGGSSHRASTLQIYGDQETFFSQSADELIVPPLVVASRSSDLC